VLLGTCLEVLTKSIRILSHINQPPVLDSKRGFPEYKSRALPLSPTVRIQSQNKNITFRTRQEVLCTQETHYRTLYWFPIWWLALYLCIFSCFVTIQWLGGRGALWPSVPLLRRLIFYFVLRRTDTKR
jgi:hypothetical protein